MRQFSLLFVFAILANLSFAQSDIVYENPPSTIDPSFKIECVDIVSDAEICKFKMIVENTSKDEYILMDFEKVGFVYEERGTYYPSKAKNVVIYPGKNKSDVVKISDAFDYRVDEFELDINGLKSGKVAETIAFSDMMIAIDENKTVEIDGIEITCSKVSVKKEEVTLQFEVVNSGAIHDLIVVNPSALQVMDGANALDISTKDDEKALQADASYKFKLSGASSGTDFTIEVGDLIRKVNLTDNDIPNILVRNSVVPKVKEEKVVKEEEPIVIVDNAPSVTCPPFKGEQNGSVKVKLHMDENYCFKLDVDGFPVITEYTQNSIIYLEEGSQRLKFYFSDGSILEDKVFIASGYSTVGYKLKLKGNGEFNLKYVVGQQVLNEEGKQNMDDMMAKTDAMMKEGLASVNESTNNSSTSNTSNTCYGDHSSGSTSVKIKVTWKGSPVSGHGIRIKNGDDILGNNETDYDGLAIINAYSLPSSNVDVYGCKGSSSWSVKGSWVQLDNSNFYHLRLDEVAEFMSEMTGMSIDEIGVNWGMK